MNIKIKYINGTEKIFTNVEFRSYKDKLIIGGDCKATIDFDLISAIRRI